MSQSQMARILIVYGSRYGSTKEIAHHIGQTLTKDGHSVDVFDASKQPPMLGYDLIIVGSGIQAGRWKKDAMKFLKKNKNTLQKMKTALFVSCGDANEPDKKDDSYQKYLVSIARSYGLFPIAYGFFGGSFDFTGKKGVIYNLFMKLIKGDFEKKGIKTDGIYDFRNWDSITNWAQELEVG
jgi:menaquinone-dependent protoporphyrinogen oxidase